MSRVILITIFSFLYISSMAQPDFYHLEVKSNNVAFTCYMNGFPVYHSSDEYESSVSLPVHIYLIGTNNSLLIEAEAIDKSKGGKVNAHIAEYQKGEVVVSNDLRAGGPALNMEVGDKTQKELVFDNERFDFSKTLIEGDVLEENEVGAYAMKLWKYKEKGDAEGFVEEMEFKVIDYAAAHEFSAQQMREGLTSQFDQTFFKDKSASLNADRISLVSYNEGRIWEIKVDGEEFLKITEEDGSMQMQVYVAKVEGKLGIVR